MLIDPDAEAKREAQKRGMVVGMAQNFAAGLTTNPAILQLGGASDVAQYALDMAEKFHEYMAAPIPNSGGILA